MEPFQQELLDVLAAQQETFTDFVLSVDNLLPTPAGVTYSKEEVRQMVTGFWVLVREGIAGKERELRDMYFSTVFPSLRDTGTPAQMMVSGSARVLFFIFDEMLTRISAPNRARARHWLIQFFSEYLGDMADVWAVKK